jgi:hypothetical protein
MLSHRHIWSSQTNIYTQAKDKTNNNNEEVETAIHEWLLKQEPDFHHDIIFNFY